MKNFAVLIRFMITLLLSVTVSCNSEDSVSPNEDDKEKTETKTETFTLEYSFIVKDSYGKNLLSLPGDYDGRNYGRYNISLKDESENIKSAKFDIAENDNNEILLNIKVEGEYIENTPQYSMTVQWGNTAGDFSDITADVVKFELFKESDSIVCGSISINDEVKWDNASSVYPLFSIIKSRANAYLPSAEPILLTNAGMVQSDNKFAVNLFKKAVSSDEKKGSGGTFISPLSINIALSMLLNGAKNATEYEIIKALEVEGYSLYVNGHRKELADALSNVDLTSLVSISNSIWYHPVFTMKTGFINLNRYFYNAEITPIYFSSPGAADIINKWCADNTNNKITEIVNDSSVEDLVVALINAIYFKGSWATGYAFEEGFTRKGNFHAKDGSVKEVDMMSNISNPRRYYYKSGNDAGYLSIPFGNGAFHMVFILPDEGKDVNDIVDNLDKDVSWASLAGMEQRYVYIQLPKFRFEAEYDLKETILPELGVKSAFIYRVADFSNMTNIGGLYISTALHK
ncbi:MAG: hypothetical protein LBJ47_03595, partial [Tannerella sp.]|nr:hypothetical protein [Tannerella sp.]